MAEQRRPAELRTVTSSTLLAGLMRTGEESRWQSYVERYRPLILGFARRHGLDQDQAEDVTQTALLEFCRAYRNGRYDRSKGRLRSWLFGIVSIQLLAWRRRSGRHEQAVSDLTDSDPAELVSAPDDLKRAWEEEWTREVLRQCLLEIQCEIQPGTYQAFDEFALKGRPAAEVALELGITENAVFGAKRRVMQRMRDILPLMQDRW